MKRFSLVVPPTQAVIRKVRLQRLRSSLAVLAALALFSPALFGQMHPAGSQSVDGRVYMKVYVTLPNASVRYNPMEDVPVVIYRARGDSLVIRTDGAGETGKGVALFLMNVGGAALAINGLAQCDGYYSDGCNDGQMAVGAAFVVVTWIYSMADAPGAAGRYNRKHARVEPVVGLGPRGGTQVGMRLALGR